MRLRWMGAGALVALLGTAAVAAAGYTTTPIGILPGAQSSFGNAINGNGVVVGTTASNPWGGTTFHAFRYDEAQADGSILDDLGTLGGAQSEALAVNAAGQSAGWAAISNGYARAVFWNGTGIVDLTKKNASVANDLNNGDAPTLVGVMPVLKVRRAFQWRAGKLTDLGSLNGKNSAANSVNDLGQAVGESDYGTSGNYQAVLFQGGAITSLGGLAGPKSRAFAINNGGQVAGWGESEVIKPNGARALRTVIWNVSSAGAVLGKQVVDPLPGDVECWPEDINNQGVVLAISQSSTGGRRYFLWDPVNLHHDLSGVLDAGWTLDGLREINDGGQIAGTAMNSGGVRYAVRLNPF